MLKNLYKHELRALFRTLLPVYGVLLLLSCGDAVLLRQLAVFESDTAYIIAGLIVVFYFITVAAAGVLAIVAILRRFYTNCFGREGYLTFSLPFTAGQHLTCKAVCAVVVEVITALVVLGTAAILLAGEIDMEMIRFVYREITEALADYVESAQVILAVVTAVISLFTGILQGYFCLAFGQRAKSRLGGAIATYFVLQLIGNLLSMVGGSGLNHIFVSDWLVNFSGRTLTYLTLTGALVWQVILLMVFLYGTWHELDRKLNLA